MLNKFHSRGILALLDLRIHDNSSAGRIWNGRNFVSKLLLIFNTLLCTEFSCFQLDMVRTIFNCVKFYRQILQLLQVIYELVHYFEYRSSWWDSKLIPKIGKIELFLALLHKCIQFFVQCIFVWCCCFLASSSSTCPPFAPSRTPDTPSPFTCSSNYFSTPSSSITSNTTTGPVASDSTLTSSSFNNSSTLRSSNWITSLSSWYRNRSKWLGKKYSLFPLDHRYYLVLDRWTRAPCMSLEAISIFIGLPSRGTPSYCFIAKDMNDIN